MNTKNILNCIPNCTRYESAISNLRVMTVENAQKDFYYSRDEDSNLLEIQSDPNEDDYNNEGKVSNVSLVKFKLNTDFELCKVCNSVHCIKPTASQQKTANQQQSVFLDLFKSSSVKSNLLKPSQTSKHDEVRQKIISSLSQLDKLGQLYKLNLNFEHIKLKLANSIQVSLIDGIDSQREQLLQSLDECEDKCVKSVDTDSEFWREMEAFIEKHHINTRMINEFLDQPPSSEAFKSEIENFNEQLDEKQRKFYSYLTMGKKVFFEANSFIEGCAINTESEFLFGLLNFVKFY
jgi:hypothetical protein